MQRSTCAVKVAFVPFATHENHWATGIGLPHNVPFEIVHTISGMVVYTGNGGTYNKKVLSSDEIQLFTGERYVLQSLSSEADRQAVQELVDASVKRKVRRKPKEK